jgi:hypothetical protein
MRITVILFVAALATLVQGEEDYVAHEWGTFTSFQGSDGVVLDWRPLETSELPKFVYELASRPVIQCESGRKILSSSKYAIAAPQRLETPVLYFYPRKEMVVDVSVRFPDGLISEWFPQVRDFAPSLAGDVKSVPVKDGYLRWGKIRLFPEQEHPELAKLIPEQTDEGKNYFAARETDAAYVRVGAVIGEEKFDHEKFLFYRGLGNFALPLEIKSGDNGTATLRNTGQDSIARLFILCVEDGGAPFISIQDLKAGEERKISLPTVKHARVSLLRADLSVAGLKKQMEQTLMAQGLYQREAAAMVKTWSDSWFTEPGLRVFYLLPQSWTDRVLPLTLDPKPLDIKRIMVGRAELMTPEMEQALARNVGDLASADFDTREKANAAIRKMGRFAEPALKRVLEISKEQEVVARAKKLLEEMGRPAGR